MAAEPSSTPKADIYINNTIEVTVDDGSDNCIQAERATLLATEIVARKLNKDDPIP